MSLAQATRAIQQLESRLKLLDRDSAQAVGVPSLEDLFTGSEYFGVDTATPLQRAICRIAEGLPLGELAHDEIVQRALSSWTDKSKVWSGAPIPRPDELVILGATRSAKTRFMMATAFRLAVTCDMRALKVGELPRVPIVSYSIDLATATYGQLVGAITSQPALRRFLVGTPTADSIVLRHPLGRHVEITVSAGRRGGNSLVARWLAGAVFDEAPRMSGSDDGAVINLDDSLTAIRSRLLPGAQVLLGGSPWAPQGTVYKKVQESHGAPTARLVVVRAKGPWLNPFHWTPERAEKLRTSKDPTDQLSYRTDCEADWADPETGLLAAAEVDACMKRSALELPGCPGVIYAAAMDPAVRLNAWTLVVKHREAGRDVIDLARQWQRRTSEGPLDADNVLAEVAKALLPYGVKNVATDKWQVDTLTSLARHHGLSLMEYDFDARALTELYLDMAMKVAQEKVDLPPEPDLRADLLGAKRRITTNGMMIDLPTTGNGRHGDFVPSLARVLRQHVPDAAPIVVQRPLPSEADREADLLRLAKKRFAPKKDAWWKGPP